MSDDNVIILRQSVDGWRPVGRFPIAIIDRLDSTGIRTIVGIDRSKLWIEATSPEGETIRHSTSLTPYSLCECIYKAIGVKPTVRFQQDGCAIVKIK